MKSVEQAWQGYEIRPLDSLFFRGGEPFAKGDHPFLKSLFPPSPQVLQGLIRTTLLHIFCEDLNQYSRGCANCTHRTDCEVPEVSGQWRSAEFHTGTLRLRGPFLLRQGMPLFSLPLDCLTAGKGVKVMNNRSWQPVQSRSTRELWQTDLPNGSLYPVFQGMEDSDDQLGYITLEALMDYLSGGSEFAWQEQVFTVGDLLVEEGKTGIGLNSERVVEEGMIYTVEMIRLRNGVSFYFEGTNLHLPTHVTTWGGEGRLVNIRPLSDVFLSKLRSKREPIIEQIHRTGRFKLVLLQPMVLGEAEEIEQCVQQKISAKVRLQGMRTGTGQWIGGWDMAKRRPKPMRAYVPAGSVLYFTWDDESKKRLSSMSQAVVEQLVDAYLPGELGEGPDVQNGFGQCVVGGWTHE